MVTISVQPAALVKAAGEDAVFSVTATGNGDLSYKWFHDDVELVGETTATLTVSTVEDSDDGIYSVEITDLDETKASDDALLTVNVPTVITVQPISANKFLGDTITLSVTCTFDPDLPVTYQWKKGGSIVNGATASTYTKLLAVQSDSGSYTVEITNSLGTVISNAAVILVTAVAPSKPFGAGGISAYHRLKR